MKTTTIVGSGIIGLCSAYYLEKSGHKVTIIERGDGAEGCSFGNAGMIVPSHFIPLATPGMIEKGIRWMFDAESPFYVRPRLNWDLISWGINFYKAATKKRVERAMPALRDIGLLSKKLYQEIAQEPDFDFAFEEKGLMMLCKTQHAFDEEAEVAETANKLGIKAKILKISELHQIENEVKPNVAGAIFYEGDAHCYPNVFVKQLKTYLEKKGVVFKYNAEVTGFEVENDSIKSLRVNRVESLEISNLIIATGSWSPLLAKMLNLNLPMQAGKGYSITKEQIAEKKLKVPSILLEARVAITPMADNLIRFGGTMEIGGINDKINMSRVRGIVKSVPEFFPQYALEVPAMEQVWYGLRPCSPDGMPYIGRTQKFKNLTVASGHAMMGLSLAPATGQLVQEIVDNQATTIDIDLYKADRF
jgi:D-amino-acid dehydrogenase